MEKMIWLLLLILIPCKIFGQIQIDQVGDDWASQVDSALTLIKNTDKETYDFVLKHCKKISFWDGLYSTVEGNNTITISNGDMKIESIENIACIIVHESKHLEFIQLNLQMPLVHEECICYFFEMDFIKKIRYKPDWIMDNCGNMILKFGCSQ